MSAGKIDPVEMWRLLVDSAVASPPPAGHSLDPNRKDPTMTTDPASPARMTPARFRSTTELLGLSQADLADWLDVNERTVRHWLAGRYSIPEGVAEELDELDRYTGRRADEIRAALARRKVDRVVVTFRSDAGFEVSSDPAAARTGLRSARWHRHMVARAVAGVDNVSVVFAEDRDAPF